MTRIVIGITVQVILTMTFTLGAMTYGRDDLTSAAVALALYLIAQCVAVVAWEEYDGEL